MSGEPSNEPFQSNEAKGRSRSGSLVSLDGQPPQRRQSSTLGTRGPQKRASQLERLGFVEGDADTKQPQRSPIGAARTQSGLIIKPATPNERDQRMKEAAAGVQWHSLELEELYRELKSTPDGLSAEEAAARLLEHGMNQLTVEDRMHPVLKFLLSLVMGFQAMMNIGAILCFIVYAINPEDDQTLALGIMLIVVVLLTSAFQTYQEGKADKIMDELKNLAAENVYVYRNKEVIQIPSEQITIGDIVQVKAGEKVPADMRILSATELKINNAPVTGENLEIKLGPNPQADDINEAKNIARSGCAFTCGHGVGIVYAIGKNTFFGKIASSTLETERPDSLMRREIDRMILILSILAVILGIAFTIIAIFFDFTWVQAVAFGIGIIVANVPEGLLSQLVVTLALTAKNLKKDDVLVTRLDIIETLGAVSVICSDKTGTLTCNRMTVSHCVYDGQIFRSPQVPNEEGVYPVMDPKDSSFQEMMRVIALNTDAIFLAGQDDVDDILKRETKGDASESALIKFVQPNRDVKEFREKNPRLASIPFNSVNKWMLSINANEDPKGFVQVLVKGAPERVLGMCAKAKRDGKIVDMDEKNREYFEGVNVTLASMGERVLGFASLELKEPQFNNKDFEFDTESEIPNFPMNGLVFHGFCSLIDPPREGVKQAVADCRRAGIKVFMVTGDHPITALAIAKSIGITTLKTAKELEDAGQVVPELYDGCIAVHGTELPTAEKDDKGKLVPLPEHEQAIWDNILRHREIVFARTLPEQKQQIVEQLRALGHVVAMTGDGVNDAPALKTANVGVAMGSGTSVAKEAATIIIMKDDFKSIVTGVRAGRLVFACLKKVITYVLVSNTPQIIPFLAFVATGIPLGIETIVILTIDLGTDILPAIAMAYEGEEDETMGKPPRSQDDHLVTVQMIGVTYATVGLMHTFASYFGFFYVLLDLGFSLDRLFGAGLGFRDKWEDLSDSRKDYFFDTCLEMPRYLNKYPNVNMTEVRSRSNPICTTEFATFREEALQQAQASFFFTIIWGQIANIFIRKTFTESILTPYRLLHNKQVIGAIIFELWLSLMLVYVPGLNTTFLMRGIKAEYLFCTLWYIPLLICYDEIRKFYVRNYPNGLCAKITHF